MRRLFWTALRDEIADPWSGCDAAGDGVGLAVVPSDGLDAFMLGEAAGMHATGALYDALHASYFALLGDPLLKAELAIRLVSFYKVFMQSPNEPRELELCVQVRRRRIFLIFDLCAHSAPKSNHTPAGADGSVGGGSGGCAAARRPGENA